MVEETVICAKFKAQVHSQQLYDRRNVTILYYLQQSRMTRAGGFRKCLIDQGLEVRISVG